MLAAASTFCVMPMPQIRQLRVGHTVDRREVGDAGAHRVGPGIAANALGQAKLTTRAASAPAFRRPRRTRRRGPCCRCRTSSWRYRPGSANAWRPSWSRHLRSPSTRWRHGQAHCSPHAVVTLHEQTGRHVHERQGAAPSTDVRRRADEAGARRIERGRRRAVPGPLVADARGDADSRRTHPRSAACCPSSRRASAIEAE